MQTNKNKLNQKLMLYSVDKFYLLCYNSNVITKLKHRQTDLILQIVDGCYSSSRVVLMFVQN